MALWQRGGCAAATQAHRRQQKRGVEIDTLRQRTQQKRIEFVQEKNTTITNNNQQAKLCKTCIFNPFRVRYCLAAVNWHCALTLCTWLRCCCISVVIVVFR